MKRSAVVLVLCMVSAVPLGPPTAEAQDATPPNQQVQGASPSEWTYWSETRADGTVYGEGNGVMTTAEGDVINMRGVAAAKSVGEDGSVAYRGAMFFHTDSEKHAALNGGTGVFEYNVDSDGVTKATVWEWS